MQPSETAATHQQTASSDVPATGAAEVEQKKEHASDASTDTAKVAAPEQTKEAFPVGGKGASSNVMETEGPQEEHRPPTDVPPRRMGNDKDAPSTKKSKSVPPPRQPAKDKPASSTKSKKSKASLSHSSCPTATEKATPPNKKGASSSVSASPHRSKTHKLVSTPPSKKRRNDSEPTSSRHQKRTRT